MSCHISLFCLSLCLSVSGLLNAQSLVLSREGNEKSFPYHSYFRVTIGQDKSVPCDRAILLGTIRNATRDSILFNVDRLTTWISDPAEYSHTSIFTNGPRHAFAISDLHSFEVFKSPEAIKGQRTRRGLGGLLLTTGIVTLVNTFVVSDKDAKRSLLISGGAQATAGIVLLSFSGSKRYFLGRHPEAWQVETLTRM